MQLGPIRISSGSTPFPDRTKWTETQIRGSEKGTVTASWAGGILPVVFILIYFWFSHQPLFIAKNFPHPFICVVGLISLIAFPKAIWETIRLKRFGDPILELSKAPIPLGGTVEGRINLTSGVDQAPEFTVTLACIHRVQTNAGKNSHVSETVLWSADQKASVLLGGILPISIPVPTDQPHTDGSNPFDRILWRVTVKAPFRGPAFLEKYEVPVGQAP
jgi:hypothetical protein